MPLIEAWLPAELAAATALLLVLVSCGTSFLTAAFGIGGGVALLAVMALVVPPAMLIPIHGVVQIGSDLGRTALMIRHVRWDLMGAFAVGSLAGSAAGGLLVVQLPPGSSR